MPAQPQRISESAPCPGLEQTHGRLSRILVGALVGAVLLFDFLCVYAKGFMGAPLTEAGVISNGMVIALAIILLILAACWYYVRRVNSTFSRMSAPPDED